MFSIENSNEDLGHGREFKEIEVELEGKINENIDTSYPILGPISSLTPSYLSEDLDIFESEESSLENKEIFQGSGDVLEEQSFTEEYILGGRNL